MTIEKLELAKRLQKEIKELDQNMTDIARITDACEKIGKKTRIKIGDSNWNYGEEVLFSEFLPHDILENYLSDVKAKKTDLERQLESI